MKINVSIIIPVFNGANTLNNLFRSFVKLEDDYNKEFVVINSESTDDSIKIIKKFRTKLLIKIINIHRSDFNHGSTRNIGVQIALGQYICYISQDVSIPRMSNDILKKIIPHFQLNKKTVAVFPKQIPHNKAFLFNKIEQEVRFQILEKNSKLVEFSRYFITNSFACYQRDFLLKHPFPRADYSEDLLMGKQIIDNGYIKIYDPRCVIYHSHNYSFKEYLDIQLKSTKVKVHQLKIRQPLMLVPKLKLLIKTKATLKDKLVCFLIFGLAYIIKLFVYLKIKLFTKA